MRLRRTTLLLQATTSVTSKTEAFQLGNASVIAQTARRSQGLRLVTELRT